MTEQPSKPRSRAGLAKLRGDAPAPSPAEDAPATAPADTVEQPTTALVTLTKPAAEPDAEPEAPAPEPPASKRGNRGLMATVIALVVAVALLGFFVITNPFDSPGKSSSASAGAGTGSGGSEAERLTVIRAARQFTVSFFTYDYRNIDAYFRRIEAASTGAFRTDFVSKEATLKTVVAQLKTVATGQVPDAGAGLFQLNGDKATALIAANFNASNAVTKNGQKRYRVKIALQLVKGNWLVTDFDEVV